MKKSRRLLLLLILPALALTALLVAHHYAQPEQMAALVKDFARDKLGLELRFDGAPEVSVWPHLRLNLERPRLAMAGANDLISAERLRIAMPWSSLRGDVLRVDSIELDQPQLDLDALDAWLAASPTAQTPAAQLGLHLSDGKVVRGKDSIASGVNLDGELDLRALDAWWRGLGQASRVDELLPPGAIHLRIAQLRWGGAAMDGVDLQATP